ncbi:hypothetical protein C8R45DRAFT_1041188, partial [Mycena sanguinolenta]
IAVPAPFHHHNPNDPNAFPPPDAQGQFPPERPGVREWAAGSAGRCRSECARARPGRQREQSWRWGRNRSAFGRDCEGGGVGCVRASVWAFEPAGTSSSPPTIRTASPHTLRRSSPLSRPLPLDLFLAASVYRPCTQFVQAGNWLVMCTLYRFILVHIFQYFLRREARTVPRSRSSLGSEPT